MDKNLADFVMLWAKTPATQKVEEMAQIGRENLDGTPVAREVRGLNDIQSATGMRPTFYPTTDEQQANKFLFDGCRSGGTISSYQC
jgi:hypothetical protein